MAVFVHLTTHQHIEKIKRQGIKRLKKPSSPGVYAMPVTPDFYVSHQWLRELKRFNSGSIMAVYFRVAGDEPCLVGHYSKPHLRLTADQAIDMLMTLSKGEKPSPSNQKLEKEESFPSSVEGFELLFERNIQPRNIIRIKRLPQVIGWRYFPDAKGKRPCICLCCEKGEFGIQKLLSRVEEAEAKGLTAKPIVFGREDDSFKRVEKLKEKLSPQDASLNPETDGQSY